MKKWEDVKKNLKSLTKEDSYALDEISTIITKLIMKRKELNITQNELSKLSKVGTTTIVRIETGEIKPNILTLIKITKALKLKIKIE